jgi:type I restriction enzyme S subunit
MSEPLPIPPLDEQLGIVDHLTTERGRLDELANYVKAEVELLNELRSSTITDAVLGRFDVRVI